MKQIAKLTRLLQINLILAKYGLDKVIFSIPLLSPIRFLSFFNPWNWFRRTQFSRGQAIRHALEDLGPVFVKFGQALSTRRDLFPEDIANELALLQDKVPPFPSIQAKQILEAEYKQPLTKLFKSFSDEPLASASIAQIHTAKLPNGQTVVVKIRRPKITKIIQQDVSLLHTLARLIEKYWSEGKRLKPCEIVAEFERNILAELDLLREAASASQLKRNFRNSSILYVPQIYWPYARKKVIVMERIYGIPIADVVALKQQGFDMKQLAERGIEIFFTQVFRDSFFHADMHPGNIFVNYNRIHDPQYISIDFGIMGTLTEADKRYLARAMLAFFHRDYRLVAKIHLDCGWLPKDTRLDEFEAAIRTVCEPIFERPLQEVSFAQVVMQMFQCGQQFNMTAQPQLITLQKTLFALEGLVRHLYPALDLWSTAKPFLDRTLREQIGPSAFLKKMQTHAVFWSEQAPELPILLHDVLSQIKRDPFSLGVSPPPNAISVKPTKRFRRGFLYGTGITLLIVSIANLSFKYPGLTHWLMTENLWISLTIGSLLLLLITWINK